MNVSKWLAVSLVGSVVAIAACGDSGTDGAGGSNNGGGGAAASGCATNPFACMAGTTCAFVDVTGSKIECLPSGAGHDGDACMNIAGMPSCSDGLICLQLQPGGGTCQAFCDSTHPCANGAACAAAKSQAGVLFHICAPMTTTTTSSSSSASSSSTSSASSSSSTASGTGGGGGG